MASGPPNNPPDHPAYTLQTLTGDDAKDDAEMLKRCQLGMTVDGIVQPTEHTPARLLWANGYSTTDTAETKSE